MKTKLSFTIIILILILPVSLYAADFGLTANIHGGFGNSGNGENSYDVKTDLWPRFSMLIGDNAEFRASAGVTFEFEDEFSFIPELLQTEFSMRFGAAGIRLGRLNYSDPLSFIAEGLFDGVQYFYNTSFGNFRAGIFYTGFLYKNNSSITMTVYDKLNFDTPVELNNFFNTYFAPKRAFAAVGWEHPSLGELMHFRSTIIGQIDLTGSDIKYHNQYLILKTGVPVDNFLIELGCSLEVSQTVAEKSSTDIAFAGEFGFFWLIPGEFNSRLSFTGRFAGGAVDGFCSAFVPITAKNYGYILKHKMSGLSVLSANYSSRFNKVLAASATASYFIRNDLGTFSGYPLTLESPDGFFLGPEASGRITWSPASDLQLNLGAGVFIPALGNTSLDEKTHWRADLTVTMSLF